MESFQYSVSVIIPTYNDPEFLDESITSALSQKGVDVNIEVIIVDSSDDDRVKRIIDKYDDQSVQYSWVEPAGVASARNHGLDLATGDVIGFCDADDYWHDEKLAHQLPLLDDGADIVYSDEYLIDNGKSYRLSSLPVTSPETHHIDYFRSGGVGSRSVLARAECFETERFDERFSVREDPHLWTRLFAQFEPARVNAALSYKRRREESITSDIDRVYEMELQEIADLIDRYPELEPYREEREMRAKREYAKRLLSETDRVTEARAHLRDVLQSNYRDRRTLIFYAISLVPWGNTILLRGLQRGKWRVSRAWRAIRH